MLSSLDSSCGRGRAGSAGAARAAHADALAPIVIQFRRAIVRCTSRNEARRARRSSPPLRALEGTTHLFVSARARRTAWRAPHAARRALLQSREWTRERDMEATATTKSRTGATLAAAPRTNRLVSIPAHAPAYSILVDRRGLRRQPRTTLLLQHWTRERPRPTAPPSNNAPARRRHV